MILAAIVLENYKQYAGAHRIEFPEQGIVAITGPNGAGKTTLFEAIEWCLYGPYSIRLGDIPPHGGEGHTRVSITLQDPKDGRRFVVERKLRRGATTAEAFNEDDPGQPVVQGPKDVSDYVAKTLIGLPHGAFVSTFFTRQKELTFFGDRKPTERRVEVARLLGFQTIRDAQEEISQERNVARQEANALRAQLERDAASRDPEAEIERATTEVAGAESLAAAAHARLAAADAAYAEARAMLEHWRTLQEQDAAHERELLTIAGSVQAAVSRRAAAEAELGRLVRLGEERVGLAEEAGKEAPLAERVAGMEAERERARRLEALHQAARNHERQLAAAAGSLRTIVLENQQAAAGLDGWVWHDDADDPCQEAARLLVVVASVDHRGARRQAEAMRRAFELAQKAADVQNRLDHYRTFRENLARQRDELLQDGEPSAMLAVLDADIAVVQRAIEAAVNALGQARQDRQRAQELEEIFDPGSLNRICPTCTRPISDEDAVRLQETLRDATRDKRATEALCEQAVAEARQRLESVEADRAAAARRAQQIATLAERLADGDARIGDLEAEHGRDLEQLRSALNALSRQESPSAEEIEAAQEAAERAAQLAEVGGAIEQIGQRAAASREGLLETEREAAALGDVAYDPGTHAEAQRALEAARHAAAQVKRIDIELGQRAGYEATRTAAERELGDLERRRRDSEAARIAVGFQPEALHNARTVEIETGTAQHSARDEAAQAREALRDAQAALRRVTEERDRLRELAEEADRRGREADELDRMYREFGEFDKFVADRVGPLLAETTERLLSHVTHGKYDRVRFDENYGIEVFDGDECFKLESFSGGERDVVALCARLAMSELVGSAAVRPPRFLVLDEVFGSLDSERRGQLLETLGSLASSGHFQQMFIISHVDDVQLSPVMNEAWTIEERDGVSRVHRPVLAASLV